MSDCSRHSKQVAGISDMKLLAEAIGDLHYETLAEFLSQLSIKIKDDAIKDSNSGRIKLAGKLFSIWKELKDAKEYAKEAWQISKPFM